MNTAKSVFHVVPSLPHNKGDEIQASKQQDEAGTLATGAFVSFLGGAGHDQQRSELLLTRQPTGNETEDEEVKMNCIGGIRGVQDFDMNTTDDDDDDDDNEDNLSNADDDDDDCNTGKDDPMDSHDVVKFISDRVPRKGSSPLLKPKATLAPTPPNTLHGMGDDSGTDGSDDDDESSCSSVGARGVPFAMDTPNEDDASSSSDDEDDDESLEDDVSTSDELEPDSTDAAASQSKAQSKEYSPAVVVPASSNEEEEDDEEEDEEGNGDDFDTGSNDELSEILMSLGEDPITAEPEDMDSSERFIGVMEDRTESANKGYPKTKRVLSFNTLSALNGDSSDTNHSSKRRCKDQKTLGEKALLLGDSFSLGLAMCDAPMMLQMQHRESSPLISSSSEDEDEYDRQLSEELADSLSQKEDDRQETPVPLLTPPGSPLMMEVDGGAVIEWPSNLIVDAAMAAASEMRPLSPASFEDLDASDDSDLDNAAAKPSTTLTPMLRGISV